jgi:hypothetical protein
MEEDSCYSNYDNFVESVVKSKNINEFKSHPRYTSILEHVTYDFGQKYIELIKTEFPEISIDSIKEFCLLNDSIGSPNRYYFKDIKIYASTTSLRYIYHALLIIRHLRVCKSRKIVELGCGYGGLCVAINFFKHNDMIIDSYTCIDLSSVIELQKLYLSNFQLSFNVDFVDSNSYGKDIPNDNMFLISNYCFSEINTYYQTKYIQHLFSKINHGFIIWNHIPLYDFGKHIIKIEQERPLTGSKDGNSNLFVFF